MIKILEPLAVYSNIFFLIPLYISFKFKNYGGSLLVASIMIASILFHIYKPVGEVWWWDVTSGRTFIQNLFLWLDTVIAIVLFIYVSIIFYKKGSFLIKGIALCLGVLGLSALFFHIIKDNYEYSHTLWHFTAAVLISFAFILQKRTLSQK